MIKKKKGVGVVVGRFQVQELHEGHLAILDAADQHFKLLVFIGVHPFLSTPSNPLDFISRSKMIQEKYPHAITIALPDNISDKVWSDNLDHLIRMYCPLDEVKLYCGRDSFKSHYLGKFGVFELEEVHKISGTETRDLSKQNVLSTVDFRAGMIYGVNNKWPTVYPTVDIAVIRYEPNINVPSLKDYKILLGRRKGFSHWIFPGGFVDITDKNLEDAAKRELMEETGLCIDKLHYVNSYFVSDWRCSENVKILTTLFMSSYNSGAAIANDDLGDVDWKSLDKVNVDFIIAPNHSPLMEDVISKVSTWR